MGSPSDEPVGQRWVRSSPHHEGEGVLIHPPYQGNCGRHGTEEQRVTSGGLTESLGGTRVSGLWSRLHIHSSLPIAGVPRAGTSSDARNRLIPSLVLPTPRKSAKRGPV